jgi:hypothetical protein
MSNTKHTPGPWQTNWRWTYTDTHNDASKPVAAGLGCSHSHWRPTK